ncbi:hypothetical protein ACWJJH_05930 [Endozoicomonadaceae bacterium StTr2]
MGWFGRNSATSSPPAATNQSQDGWFSRARKYVASRFQGKSAEAVSGRVQPQVGQNRSGIPDSHNSGGLFFRRKAGPVSGSRGGLFSRNKLKKLASAKKIDPDVAYQLLKAEFHQGGARFLKMLGSDMDGLVRIIQSLSVEQQHVVLGLFFAHTGGVRTPEEACLGVDLVARLVASGHPSGERVNSDELLLYLAGSDFRPFILVPMMNQMMKYGLLTYGSMLHFSRHYYLCESQDLQERLQNGEPLRLGVPPDVARELVGGEEYLTETSPDPFSLHTLELMQFSVLGRLLNAAKQQKAPRALQRLIVMFDHLPKKGLPEYNQKYGNGKEVVGVADARLVNVMDRVTPQLLERLMAAHPVTVPYLLQQHGWKELPPDFPRTMDNAPEDFVARYLRQHVAPPEKPVRNRQISLSGRRFRSISNRR